MTSSSRFAVAVHILALMALDGEKPITSEQIARSVNTHPVVIRRLLGRLRRGRLVIAVPGVGGGARLARPPEQITLLQVYRSVEDGDLFSLPQHPPDPACTCGRNIETVLRHVFAQAEEALASELADVTVAQVLHGLQTAG